MAAAPDEDDVCSLLELFGGRFDSSDMEYFLRTHHNDKRAVVDYLLSTEPSEIRKSLNENQNNWNLVTNLRRLKQQHHKFDRAKKGIIHTTVREFSCIQCDKFWWRRVPKRKMVSTCRDCHQKYRPIPRKREWGVAEYTCANCYHNFRGWGQMEVVWSPCFQCGTPCKPKVIIPPSELEGSRGRRKHQCMAPDCYNRIEGDIWCPPDMDRNLIRITCVHPTSRRLNGLPIVVEPSDDHVSSGSTVATFLNQGNLKEVYDEVVFSPPLPTIGED